MSAISMEVLQPHQLPQSLLSLRPAPRQLYFRGSLELLQPPLLAVVGARQAQEWVREWLEYELGSLLREFPVTILSGGARGVDQWAHRLALRSGRGTVIVLPSGLGHLYPKSLLDLLDHPQTLLLSEYSPEQPMLKHHFFRRNQIIAALAPVTLVVQASERSGTMITARAAMEYGKTVAALPGSPLDPQMSGNNQLLFEGAAMVRSAHDLSQLLGSFGFFSSSSSEESRTPLATEAGSGATLRAKRGPLDI